MGEGVKNNRMVESAVIGNIGHIIIGLITGGIMNFLGQFCALNFYSGSKIVFLAVIFILTLFFWFYMGIHATKSVSYTHLDVYKRQALGKLDKSVLVIDIDPQGNTTSGLGVDKRDLEISIYDVLINGVDAQRAIIKTPFRNLSLLPSVVELAGAEIELTSKIQRELRLKESIKGIVEEDVYKRQGYGDRGRLSAYCLSLIHI